MEYGIATLLVDQRLDTTREMAARPRNQLLLSVVLSAGSHDMERTVGLVALPRPGSCVRICRVTDVGSCVTEVTRNVAREGDIQINFSPGRLDDNDNASWTPGEPDYRLPCIRTAPAIYCLLFIP